MHVRRFDGSAADAVQRPGARGVRATVIQLPGMVASQTPAADLAQRFHGAPHLVDRPTGVVALHFGTDAEIDEHSADEPILFLVIEGKGFVKIAAPPEGGACPSASAACAALCGRSQQKGGGDCSGEMAVAAGDSVLWPAGLPHRAWTSGCEMTALAIHYGRDSK